MESKLPTPAELKVLSLLKEDLVVKQAATVLGISPNTAANQVTKAKERFGVHSVHALLYKLAIAGILFAVISCSTQRTPAPTTIIQYCFFIKHHK